MATKHTLRDWILEALQASGGTGRPLGVCKYIWSNYEDELRASGDLFCTWQYDMRWAAQTLRDEGTLVKVDGDRHRPWTVA